MYVCTGAKKPINKKKKTPSGTVPMMRTGGSCYYDIWANNNFLSFPKARRSSGEKRERERQAIINNKRVRKA
jgi:hypothetical protein